MDFLEPLVTLLLSDYTTDKQVQSLMSYLLQVGETNNLEGLITSLTSSVPKHEETFMTVAEQLRQQGEQRGRQEGRQEALKEMAIKMMLNGIEPQSIVDVTGLTKDEIAQLSH
ncbi:ISNCY family transposase, partial [Vibrio sp. 10N.261.48.A2]